MKIRHYGLLAPANVGTLFVTARKVLGVSSAPPQASAADAAVVVQTPPQRICPMCGGRELSLLRLAVVFSSDRSEAHHDQALLPIEDGASLDAA